MLYDCMLIGLGMHSASVHLGCPLPLGRTQLYFEPAGWIDARPEGLDGDAFMLRLDLRADQRRALLLRLFTTAADPIARTANLKRALRGVFHRAFRAA
jgi:cellulose synthase (UDP-forming)